MKGGRATGLFYAAPVEFCIHPFLPTHSRGGSGNQPATMPFTHYLRLFLFGSWNPRLWKSNMRLNRGKNAENAHGKQHERITCLAAIFEWNWIFKFDERYCFTCYSTFVNNHIDESLSNNLHDLFLSIENMATWQRRMMSLLYGLVVLLYGLVVYSMYHQL